VFKCFTLFFCLAAGHGFLLADFLNVSILANLVLRILLLVNKLMKLLSLLIMISLSLESFSGVEDWGCFLSALARVIFLINLASFKIFKSACVLTCSGVDFLAKCGHTLEFGLVGCRSGKRDISLLHDALGVLLRVLGSFLF